MQLEKLFGLSKEMTRVILVSSVLFAIGMLHIIIKPEPEETYQIVKDGQYHLTSDPITNGECVVFTDEDGMARRICKPFSMKGI